MRNRRLIITMVLAILLAGGLTRASLADDGSNSPSEQDISRVRQKLETLRAWKLTEFLNLDEQTSARLFPAMREADRDRQAVEAENRKLVQRMTFILKNGGVDQTEMAGILDQLQKNRRKLARIEERHFTKVRAILSPADTARYILFQIRFQQEIRKRISRAARDTRDRRDSRAPRDSGMNRENRDFGSDNFGDGSFGGGGSGGGRGR